MFRSMLSQQLFSVPSAHLYRPNLDETPSKKSVDSMNSDGRCDILKILYAVVLSHGSQ